jgi:hypothetical protein
VSRLGTSVVLTYLAVLTGCEAIDVLSNCQNVCDKYQDCFDPEYDVGACRSRCQENSDNDDFADEVDSCEACIDDRTCVDGAFDCGPDCNRVVP